MTGVGIIGRSVVTPLGDTPEGVFQAAREGCSALKPYTDTSEVYWASRLERKGFGGDSFFEAVALEAACKAVADAGIDPSGAGFILSTIKGDIEKLGSGDVSLAASAAHIARALGVQAAPVVVSNACISGVAALVQGMRMIRDGAFRHVIVVGAELQSRFIVTGFQALKALSQEPCRPFDAARDGLNLGEAAAAMVLTALDTPEESAGWELLSGAIRNDANHISGPSRTGEGSYNALRAVLPFVRKEDLAFVNVHGTATRYNDEMEAIALDRAGLLDVPINSLKGVFGHTMGAAGILESILSMEALEAGIVLPTRGFHELGVSAPVKVSACEQAVRGNAFVKLLSGFGGVNGALLFRKGGAR